MLPKTERLKREEFTNILKSGKRLNSKHLLLYVLKNTKEKTKTKFSFSISKKISKNATSRNKLRRRGYSVIAKLKNKLRPGFMCFFSFKKGGELTTFRELEKEIAELLSVSSVIE
jgi:ribonuclease P protein component